MERSQSTASSSGTPATQWHKAALFQKHWWRHLPDLTTIATFMPHYLTRRKDCKDDSLLGTLVAAYGFTTAAMLIPAIYEFDVATGRTTIGEG